MVSAVSPDGVIEAIEKPDARFCVGVQWHPENFVASGDFRSCSRDSWPQRGATACRQPSPGDRHSPRSATDGSTRMARRAGMNTATVATSSNTTAVATNVIASSGFTP